LANLQEIMTMVEKVNQLQKENKLDLSLDEDLSIALMNLVSIEEHLYFSGMKTDKKKYFSLLNSVRELRKKLLKEIVKDSEGEVWCLSKHLLAASMRLIEVGNKYLAKKEDEKAMQKFNDAFYLYSLFWGLNLKLTKGNELLPSEEKVSLTVNASEGNSFKNSLTSIIKKILECCKE